MNTRLVWLEVKVGFIRSAWNTGGGSADGSGGGCGSDSGGWIFGFHYGISSRGM